MEQSKDQADMGNLTHGQKEAGPKLVKQASDPYKYQWEQNLIDGQIMQHIDPKSQRKVIAKAAIIGLEDGELRAWSPPSFIPEKQCIDDIIAAFKGDIDGLAERGIRVGCGVNDSVPGKMDADGIYGNDGQRGGTSAFVSKECVIILVFTANPMLANRLGIELVADMKEVGK